MDLLEKTFGDIRDSPAQGAALPLHGYKDWQGLEAVFTSDIIADFREATSVPNESLLKHGASIYVAALAPMLANVITVHHGHVPEIGVKSPSEAHGVWAMEDKLWVPCESSFPMAARVRSLDEAFKREDGAWRIKTLRLTRLRVERG